VAYRNGGVAKKCQLAASRPGVSEGGGGGWRISWLSVEMAYETAKYEIIS